MIVHTAHTTPFPGQFSIKNAKGELIATVVAASKDGYIARICWYGGERHGKTDLAEGGLEGAMEFIGAAHTN